MRFLLPFLLLSLFLAPGFCTAQAGEGPPPSDVDPVVVEIASNLPLYQAEVVYAIAALPAEQRPSERAMKRTFVSVGIPDATSRRLAALLEETTAELE